MGIAITFHANTCLWRGKSRKAPVTDPRTEHKHPHQPSSKPPGATPQKKQPPATSSAGTHLADRPEDLTPCPLFGRCRSAVARCVASTCRNHMAPSQLRQESRRRAGLMLTKRHTRAAGCRCGTPASCLLWRRKDLAGRYLWHTSAGGEKTAPGRHGICLDVDVSMLNGSRGA